MLLAQNLGAEQPVLNYKMPENKLTPEKNAIKGAKASNEPPVNNKNEKDIFASDFSEYNKKPSGNLYI